MLSFWRQLTWARPAKRIQMDPTAKAAFRTRLETHLQDHPVRFAARPRLLLRNVFSLHTKSLMPAFLVAALVALLGGGTSLAAENALPGEALYGLKTEVNERVVSAFSLGDAAKVEWEARRAERRLEEVAALAVKGTLTGDISARVETNFKAHAERVQDRIETLKANGDTDKAAELASRFEASLRAHDRILERLKERAEDANQEEQANAIDTVDQAGEEALSQTVVDRTEAEQTLEDEDEDEDEAEEEKQERKEAAEGKLGAATNVLAAATRYVETKKGRATDESVKLAGDALKAAQTLLDDGKAKLAAGAYGEAFVLGNKTIRAAQEAKTLLERSDKLKIEVKARASDDDTDDEDEDKNEAQKKSAERIREEAKDAAERVREATKRSAEDRRESEKESEQEDD